MGFLKRFLRNTVREGDKPVAASSFEKLSEEELQSHLGVSRYGSFSLTDAVRPSYDLQIVPSQGYRHDCYRDEQSHSNVPVLMASISKETLFETFLELLDPLGFTVDVVLETSHNQRNKGHCDLYREHIDLPVLSSVLWEYEDLLLNDGCTGLAVLNPDIPQEIQFDEHKLLIIYGDELGEYEKILRRCSVASNEQIRFITEAEHVHSSSERYAREFHGLQTRLGMDGDYSHERGIGDWGLQGVE